MIDRQFPNTFYGDVTRWFIGIVEDVNDPLRIGRVRVRIRGLHSENQSDIATSDLPWAQVVSPTTEGGTSGIGRIGRLLPGAVVFGMFLDGVSSQIPLIFGSIPKVETPRTVRRGFQPNIPQPQAPGSGLTGNQNRFDRERFEDMGAVGNTNAEKAYNFFRNYGFSREQAAGIVGNLMAESTPQLNPTIKAAGSEESYGIAQWNAAGGRLQVLKQFANDLNKDWRDIDVQLRFIIYELENYPYLGLSSLKNATSIEEATRIFEEKYERPQQGTYGKRLQYAQDVLNRFSA